MALVIRLGVVGFFLDSQHRQMKVHAPALVKAEHQREFAELIEKRMVPDAAW